MTKQSWCQVVGAVVGGGILLLALLIGLGIWVGESGESRIATPTQALAASPTPTDVGVTAANPKHPPEPHEPGRPKGLGVTRSSIQSAFEAIGFVFEPNPVDGRPGLRGDATLGEHAFLFIIGTEDAVTWVALGGRKESVLDYILMLTRLTTHKWDGAEEWARENVMALQKKEGDSGKAYGNYQITLATGTSWIQVDVRALYASCADAFAAHEWTVQGSIGSARGYPKWKVPTEPDEDGDKVVCESGLQLRTSSSES